MSTVPSASPPSSRPARAAGYTLTTLHTFSATDSSEHNLNGANSQANVTLDGMGHLYGTAYYGGTHGTGTVYELTPTP